MTKGQNAGLKRLNFHRNSPRDHVSLVCVPGRLPTVFTNSLIPRQRKRSQISASIMAASLHWIEEMHHGTAALSQSTERYERRTGRLRHGTGRNQFRFYVGPLWAWSMAVPWRRLSEREKGSRCRMTSSIPCTVTSEE